jgi:hypothetical protein
LSSAFSKNNPLSKDSSSRLLQALLLVFIAAFAIVAYAFLHELGHALAGLLSGGRLAEFNLSFLGFGPHVSLSGDFSRPQQILINLSGVALPLLVWALFMLLVPRETGLGMETLKLTSTLVLFGSLLAWLVLSLMYLAGNAPADDSTSFLRNSGMPPLLLGLLVLVILIGGWLLFRSRIRGLRYEWGLFRHPGRGAIQPGAWKMVLLLAGLLGLMLLLGLNLTSLGGPAQAMDRLTPPSGYALVKTIDLSREDAEQQPVYAFTLDAAGQAGIYLLVQNIRTAHVDVSLVGPGDYRKVILHGEGYSADADSSYLEESLQPGEYEVLLTSRDSSGRLSLYALK